MARTLTEFPDIREEARPESPIDLSSYSEADLMAVIEDAFDRLSLENLAEMSVLLKERQENMADDARTLLLKEFEEKATKMGLSLAALFPGMATGRRRRSDAGSPLPVKYRSPEGGTWSGRGRPPVWLTQAEAAGKSREEFRVKDM